MKNGYKWLWLAVLLLVPGLTAQEEQTAVIPSELENEEHPQFSQQPFNNPADNFRVQLAFPNEQIINIMPLGGTITEVAFRLDGPQGSPNFHPGGSLDTVIPDFELRASTAASQGLSRDLPQNVGMDETIVFPRGPLALLSAWDPEGPNEFSIRIPFENEFFYNPHDGDLLLDFFFYQQPGQSVVVDCGSSGLGGHMTGLIGEPTLGNGSPAIPAIQLVFRPVPEPGVAILFLSGLLGVALRMLLKRRGCISCLAITLLLVTSATAEQEQTAVIPPELEDVEHSGWSFAPFNYGADNVRVQLAFPNEQIVNAMPLGGTITEIAFRLDGPRGTPGSSGSLDTVIPEFELRASTAASQMLSRDFAQNVGMDETIVFPRGPLALVSAWNPEGPNQFSIRIPFENEFLYDPQKGDLLLDFFLYQQPGQRVVVEFGSSGLGGNMIGSISEPIGSGSPAVPAIQLAFRPVPEPSAIALFVFGFVLLPFLRRKR